MPYPDLQKSVCCLDDKRLGNQVYREGLTLLRGGWKNHPAAKIWEEYKHALAQYCLYGLDELITRGKEPPSKIILYKEIISFFPDDRANPEYPDLFGYEPFHLSHQDNLIFKDPEYYQPIFNRPIPQKKPEYVWTL